MDASHTNANTAYAAVNRIRLDDMKPHIYKTNDGGKSWKEIVNGLPNDPINVVKEDPVKKGLLFAGSERAVYVSFDDGEHWQSLRLNMPATSIRDLTIKDDDLVIGTHGRSFWILDDITALRQLNNQQLNNSAILYKPQTAYRVRWNMNTDTPLPQEEPAGQNPPDGAVINYYLNEKVNDIRIEIMDANSQLVRKYSNKDTMYKIKDVNIPLYWIRPQQILSADAGSHRFLWDMHYTPQNIPPSYPIAAIYNNTAPDFTSPWVISGSYIIKLTVDGKSYTQPLVVKMDPRVKTSMKDLQLQHDLSLMCYNNIEKCRKALNQIAKKNASTSAEKVKTISTYLGTFSTLLNTLQDGDMPPTTQMIKAANEASKEFEKMIKADSTLFN